MAADCKENRVFFSDVLTGYATPNRDFRQDVDSYRERSPETLTPEDESSDCKGTNLMVKIELDAAHALAMMARSDFDHPFVGEQKWGKRRHRTRERTRTTEIWGNSSKDFEMAVQENDHDKLIGDYWAMQREDRPTRRNTGTQNIAQKPQSLSKQASQPPKPCNPIIKKNVKIEQHADSGSTDESLKKTTKHSLSAKSKPKYQLTEAEKEERRLRRIQANRESARQTIRRRQALCEELTNKAANLSMENNSLKQEIESAMKEYTSLAEANKLLKEQVTGADNDDAKESPVEDRKGVVPMDALFQTDPPMMSSMQFPVLVYGGTPFSQFTWPSVMRPIDPTEQKPIYCQMNDSSSYNPNPPNGRSSSVGMTESRGQLLVLPCPLIYSMNNEASCTPDSDSISLKESRDGLKTQYNHQRETDLSLKLAGDDDQQVPCGKSDGCSFTQIKKENATDELITRANLIDGGNDMSGSHSKTLTLIPIFGATDPSAVNHESVGLAGAVSGEQVLSIASCSNLHSSAKLKDKHLYHKRLSDAAAATKARRRRKELTKLKSLHNRQLKLQCGAVKEVLGA